MNELINRNLTRIQNPQIGGKQGTERLNNFPKVTEQLRGQPGFKPGDLTAELIH